MGKIDKTDPCSVDYPLTPTPRTTLRTTPRTTLTNQPNSFYGVEKYEKPTCSVCTIITAWKTVAIFFSDFLAHRLSIVETAFWQVAGEEWGENEKDWVEKIGKENGDCLLQLKWCSR